MRRSFQIRAGQDTRVDATLRDQADARGGNVGGARVFLDGREVGVVPSGSGRLTLRDLDDGVYELTLLAPGYRTIVQEVRVQAGRTASVTLRLNRR